MLWRERGAPVWHQSGTPCGAKSRTHPTSIELSFAGQAGGCRSCEGRAGMPRRVAAGGPSEKVLELRSATTYTGLMCT
eukprot:15468809-Alexandrium_andersonii.AAC.1